MALSRMRISSCGQVIRMAGDVSNKIVITFGAAVWLTAIMLVILNQFFDVKLGFWLGSIAYLGTGIGMIVWILGIIAWARNL